jgi:hypothetical protein
MNAERMRECLFIANGKASLWRKENVVIIPKKEGVIKLSYFKNI